MKNKPKHIPFKSSPGFEELLSENNTLDLLDFNDTSNLLIENERKRLSMDLHDELGQIFSSVKLDILSLKFLADMEPFNAESAQQLASSIEQNINSGYVKLKNIIYDLQLNDYTDNAVLRIKKIFFQRFAATDISIYFGRMDPKARVSVNQWKILEFIIKEIITNILLHSKASEVKVEFKTIDLMTVFVVEDNGTGISNAVLSNVASSRACGLKGIFKRAGLLNGSVDFSKSNIDHKRLGTKITLKFPA